MNPMARAALTFDWVRSIGLSLPEVVESSSYGAPALKVRGRMLACVPVNKSAEPNSAVVSIDFDQRAELIARAPAIFYVTEHYTNYPTVLVRLARISRAELRDLLQRAHRCAMAGRAPRATVKSKRRFRK